jgi:thiol-disulfide isomerase/thioredoxin
MARFRSFVPPHLLLRLTGGLVLAAGLLLGGATTAAAQPEELPLGSPLPSVEGPLVRAEDGAEVPVSDLTGERATVFVFWSNQCPWVDKYEDRIAALGEQVRGKGVSMVLVNANDASSFPRESLEASREKAASAGYDAVYVRDPDAALATALGASRTPHAFVFDEAQTLVYAGAVDDSPADASSVSKPYLQQAVEAVLAGESISTADTKAFGCMIKYP